MYACMYVCVCDCMVTLVAANDSSVAHPMHVMKLEAGGGGGGGGGNVCVHCGH